MGRLPWTHEDDDGVRHNVLGMCFNNLFSTRLGLMVG
jgi:hypothetical protein